MSSLHSGKSWHKYPTGDPLDFDGIYTFSSIGRGLFLTAHLPPRVHVHSGRRLRRPLGVLSYHFPLYSFGTEVFIEAGAGLAASDPVFAPGGAVAIRAHNCAWLSRVCQALYACTVLLFTEPFLSFLSPYLFLLFLFFSLISGNKFLLWSLKIEILLLLSPTCWNHRHVLRARLKSCPWYPSPPSMSPPSSSERILFDEGNADMDK